MDLERKPKTLKLDPAGLRERVNACPRLGRRLWDALHALDCVAYRPDLLEVARQRRRR